jgi:hypothetical protein
VFTFHSCHPLVWPCTILYSVRASVFVYFHGCFNVEAFHTQESFRVTITGRPGCSAVLCRALCCIHSIWAVQTGLVSLWTLSTLRHCCAIVLVGGSMASIHVDCVADLAFMHIRSKIMYRDIIISEGCPTKSFKRILCWGFHIRIQIS